MQGARQAVESRPGTAGIGPASPLALEIDENTPGPRCNRSPPGAVPRISTGGVLTDILGSPIGKQLAVKNMRAKLNHSLVRSCFCAAQAASEERTFHVWSTLSFRNVNCCRVTLHGQREGRPHCRVWEGGGEIATGLAARDGGLVFWVQSGSVRFEEAALPSDGVQYVSAGEWPQQTKWHVLVERGEVQSCVVKHQVNTGRRLGVSKGGAAKAARTRAAAAGLNRNGASGEGADSDEKGAHTWLRRGFEAVA